MGSRAIACMHVQITNKEQRVAELELCKPVLIMTPNSSTNSNEGLGTALYSGGDVGNSEDPLGAMTEVVNNIAFWRIYLLFLFFPHV
jgi:hypothetical protein